MTRASEVLPQPGGHQRRIDGSLPASMNLRMARHSPIRCDCPTRSSSCSGLRSEASGVMDDEKMDCMKDIVEIFGQKKSPILVNKTLNFHMVPRRRLELLHLAATASKTVMSTIPSPGRIYRDLYEIIELVLEMGLEPTHP